MQECQKKTVRYEVEKKKRTNINETEKKKNTVVFFKKKSYFIYTNVFVVHSNQPVTNEQHPDKP